MSNILAPRWLHGLLVLAIVACPNAANSKETQFLLDRTAYNPIPSPDGSKVAFVETGGRPRRGGSGGVGRSNLRSDVGIADKEGKLLNEKPLADAFLAGWTPDSKRLVCYRDWRFSLVGLDGTKSQAGNIPDQESRPERVQYHSPTGRFLWLERDFGYGVVRTDGGEEIARLEHTFYPGYFALSSDGKWLAAVSEKELVVLNLAAKKWTNLGPITIHPDPGWDYIKPSWDPWFKDSAHLAFVSEGNVMVATPDGKQKKTLCKLSSAGGPVAASPDGKRVAYATFVERPRKHRPEEKFWGDARIWVIPVEPSDPAKAVTREDPDSIYCIRWLNDNEVIFDRVNDIRLPRLWRADVPRIDK